jgi:GNAT superfamily N-acetyltransferase
VNVHPLTTRRLAHLADLFGTSGTTSGCYCMYFLLTSREFDAGWKGGNRDRFEALVRTGDRPTVLDRRARSPQRPLRPAPAGLLAYDNGEPVGWCAVGPRSRYSRVLRSPLWKERDAGEDDDVWLVPCFFTRRDHRGQGVTRELLLAAVDLAAKHGATAIEGIPRSGAKVTPADAYLGFEPLFADCGFIATRRPNERRVLMRRELEDRS